MTLISLLLIFNLGIIANRTQLIKVNYFNLKNAPCRIVLMTNTSKIGNYLAIDINNHYTWIIESPESLSKSEAISLIKENITITYDNHRLHGSEIKAPLSLTSDQSYSIDFYYYHIKQIPYNYRGIRNVLGLSSSFTKIKYSLIHQLKEQGVIDHLSFSFITENNKNYFIIGGLPFDIIQNQTHSFCEIIGINHHWDCFLAKVIVYNDKRNEVINYQTKKGITDYSYFNTVDEYIYTPSDFIERLYEEYFNDLLERQKCLKYGNKNTTQIACVKAIIPIANIDFVINNTCLSFQLIDFWECSTYRYCKFLIVSNPLGEYWKFGLSFINKLNIHFNYENRRIHFYSSSYLSKDKDAINQKKYYLMIVLLVILIFGNCIMAIIRFICKDKP